MNQIKTNCFERSNFANEAPIGVFDSGFGGIYVLKELIRVLPQENFIYFGDSANAPYGTKTQQQICALSVCAAEYLIKKHVKAIVIACNTATIAAAGVLRANHPELPIIGTEPALKQAVTAYPRGRIVVMATPFTIKSEKIECLIKEHAKKSKITLLPIRGLVELIEKGITSGPEIHEILAHHFAQCSCGPVDAVVLGCTHFSFVKKEISDVLGRDVVFFNSADLTAHLLRKELKDRGLLRSKNEEGVVSGGAVTFLNSLHCVDALERMWSFFQGESY